MAETRDERIEQRLSKMSTLFEHSTEKNRSAVIVAEQDKQKNDILNELPAELRFQALQNGMPLDELRALYAEVKSKYVANKFDYQGARPYGNNERRQDNVREYEIPDKDRQRQNEYSRTRSRSYERDSRVRT